MNMKSYHDIVPLFKQKMMKQQMYLNLSQKNQLIRYKQ